MDPNQDQNQQKNKGLFYRGNQAVNVGRRFGRRFGKRSVGKMVAKRTAIFLLSNPIGWIIILILFLILLVVLIVVVFFGGSPEAPPPSQETCDSRLCVDGPTQVSPSQDICYQILLIYDPANDPALGNITLYDDYPENQANFLEATGNFTPPSPTTEVDWNLGDNQSVSQTLTDCGVFPTYIIPDGMQAFYFKIKIFPTVPEGSTIENIVGVRVQ